MINHFLGIIENAAEHGSQIDFFLELVHWLMLLLFVGWSAFFAYVLFRFNKKRNPKANYTGVKSKASSYLEIGVVIFEAVLLLGFALPLWAKRVNEFPSEKEAVVVKVVAEQYAWNIHYSGLDGAFAKQDIKLVTAENSLGIDQSDPNAKDDILVLNQLHLPINRPAIIELSSKDVIHSFAVRQMRTCQDAIPGIIIPAWFKPIKAGKYEIACAQLCGISHYRMRGELTVESQEDFDKWLAEKAKAGGGVGNTYD